MSETRKAGYLLVDLIEAREKYERVSKTLDELTEQLLPALVDGVPRFVNARIGISTKTYIVTRIRDAIDMEEIEVESAYELDFPEPESRPPVAEAVTDSLPHETSGALQHVDIPGRYSSIRPHPVKAVGEDDDAA